MRVAGIIVVAVTALSGCGTTGLKTQVSTIDPTIGTHTGPSSVNIMDSLATDYLAKYTAATAAGASSADIQALWPVGKAYARVLCTNTFRIIAIKQAQRANSRSQTNIIGGLITGAMGLSGVDAASVGGAGLAFSSIDSAFEAYDAAFSITPDIQVVDNLVRASQRVIAEEYNAVTFTTAYDVIGALNRYVYPCTFTGMKFLVEQSTNNATEEVLEKKIDPSTLTRKASGS